MLHSLCNKTVSVTHLILFKIIVRWDGHRTDILRHIWEMQNDLNKVGSAFKISQQGYRKYTVKKKLTCSYFHKINSNDGNIKRLVKAL